MRWCVAVHVQDMQRSIAFVGIQFQIHLALKLVKSTKGKGKIRKRNINDAHHFYSVLCINISKNSALALYVV